MSELKPLALSDRHSRRSGIQAMQQPGFIESGWCTARVIADSQHPFLTLTERRRSFGFEALNAQPDVVAFYLEVKLDTWQAGNLVTMA